MKARSLIVAAVAAATLALAGTASADVYRPGDVNGPNDAFRHKPHSNTWTGIHVTSSSWTGLHVRGTKWSATWN